MRYRDIIEGEVIGFPTKVPEPVTSLTNFLSDPRPLHDMYRVGDVLSYRGEVGEITRANQHSVVLALPSGEKIISRRDPDLEVASTEHWKPISESTDITFTLSAGPDTCRYVSDNEPELFDRNGRIRYLMADEAYDENHIMAWEGEHLVGVGGMQVNPYDPEQLWIKFISVDPKYQGRGIARSILRHIYEYAKAHGHRMAPGGFTEEGERLRHLHDIFDKEFPTVAYDRDARGNWVNSRGKVVRSNDQ